MRQSPIEWSEKYRGLSSHNSSSPGRFKFDPVPWARDWISVFSDKRVRKIVVKKSAQVGWTEIVLNMIGWVMINDPSSIGIMFATEDSAKDFEKEKWFPFVAATPAIQRVMPAWDKKKDKENQWNNKSYLGGSVRFVWSTSATKLKSYSIKYVFVEEPDDCMNNVQGQGDSVRVWEQRNKTFADGKTVFGGTPTNELSRIEREYLEGDRREWHVPCHDCGEYHQLAWENVKWSETAKIKHDVYGLADLDTAHYVCPHCGSIWDDHQKNENVKRGKHVATAPFFGIASFFISELNATFGESSLKTLLKKHLEAKHEIAKGNDNMMRSFNNNTLGLPFLTSNESVKADVVAQQVLYYNELTVPAGGLFLCAGVDVQHDRLAIVIRAWGRGEKSWLVYWGEIYGATDNFEAGAWVELEALLDREFIHESGKSIKISRVSIDASDGNRMDAVVQFCHKNKNKFYLPTKGASHDGGDKEIFSNPKRAGHEVVGVIKRKAVAKSQIYIVGTIRAKNMILGDSNTIGRINPQSPAAMYCYAGVRGDYFEQVCESEYRVLDVRKRKYKYIHKKTVRNEALDCEVLALHAAIGGGLHTSMLNKWAYLENEYAMQHDSSRKSNTKTDKKEEVKKKMQKDNMSYEEKLNQAQKKEAKQSLSYEEKMAKYKK